jgi:CPA1 family monovalent cation:H+ antiporter
LRLGHAALQHLRIRPEFDREDNTLINAFKEKLTRDIEAPGTYLHSIEVCNNKDHERKEFQQLMSDIPSPQREKLFKMKNEKTFTDEAIRKAEHLLDLIDLQVSDNTL